MKKSVFTIFIIGLLSMNITVFGQVTQSDYQSVLYEKKESGLEIQMIVPEFSDTLGETAAILNEFVFNQMIDEVGNFQRAIYTNAQERYLRSIYYLTVSKDILCLNLHLQFSGYYGEGHEQEALYTKVINTSTKEQYDDVSDLFLEDSGWKEFIVQSILSDIAENSEIFGLYAEQIIRERDGKFSFYINGNSIIIYFDNYEIAPYETGLIEFAFEFSQLEKFFKPEVAKNLKGKTKAANIYINGLPIKQIQASPYSKMDGAVMLPLREVGEQLGLVIAWDNQFGAIVNGKPASGTVELKEGVAYVECSYLNKISGKNIQVMPDTGWIHIFDAKKRNSVKEIQLLNFQMPESEQQCVEAYVKAVMQKNRVVQLGLMNQSIRSQCSPLIIELTSNFRISDYDIKERKTGVYMITFHIQGSDGTFKEDIKRKITVQKEEDTLAYSIMDMTETVS